MGISPDLCRKSYRGHRPSLRTPIGALVLCICLAVLIVGSGLSATSGSAATASASPARKWAMTSATPTIARSSNKATTFPTSVTATYDGYENSFQNGYGGFGADITTVFTPTGDCSSTYATSCSYTMSGVSGTLFGNTATDYSGGLPCSVTITPKIEQYLLTYGQGYIYLSTEFGGPAGNGSGGLVGFDFFVDRVPPELSYCDAGVNAGGPPGSILSVYPGPWSPGTKTSTWPLGNGATGSVHINWTSNVAPVWAVPTPAEAPVCHGTSGSAAYTALAVVSSGRQCSAENKPSESIFAENDTKQAADTCMPAPVGHRDALGVWVDPALPTEKHRFQEWLCSWIGEVAVADYESSKDPPDPNFRVVFQPKPLTVPRPETCPRLRGPSCRRLRTAELQYLDALANVTSVSEAVAVTANRFGGAKDAGDLSAERLQSVAETKYLPLQASAISGLRQAGRRLGSVLRSDHLNTAVTAKQVAQGREQLRKLDGIPGSLITRIERDGLITSRGDLKRIIAALLKNAPRGRATTLAQILEM
jgi:hypothetical protein